MTTAYVFPGQGSQFPGMGRAFYEEWETTRKRFDALNAAVDVDLHDRCFDGASDALRRTANTQPAVFATGIATHAGVCEHVGPPDYVAGHSLGHITAAAAAGALSDKAGIDLVRRRGELMQAAARANGPGTMVSVLLADPETVVKVCGQYADASVAGFNGPRNTAVSGRSEAVADVRADLDARTRARFVDLDVSAAFHSPVMEPARDPFGDALESAPLRPATTPVCSDVTGELYTDPAVARRDLAAQLTAPIDWVSVVERLADCGVTRYVAFPPAGTLSELIDRIAPDAEIVRLEGPADVEEVTP
jgi:[acyl-carrier-protein] S-malonyltransferase